MINPNLTTILAIESSCDDTSAAILQNGKILANIVAGQQIHEQYGGVVPELASRAHQQNIIPVVDLAIKKAGISLSTIDAVAYTQGPGLMGSLLVGASFAKGLAMALNKPLVPVHHMQAHILAHFIEDGKAIPSFPFLCLTVSGGHTQIVLLHSHFNMEILGQTTDDAAGEAFDKAAKMLGLPYPGGPLIDTYAKTGNPLAYKFPISQMPDYNYSFSGLKTSFLNFIHKETQKQPDFVELHLNDICASIQYTIVETLLKKFELAIKNYAVKHIGLAGGVAANSALRKAIEVLAKKHRATAYIPEFQYCTDNAAMIAIAAYYKFKLGVTGTQHDTAKARMEFDQLEK